MSEEIKIVPLYRRLASGDEFEHEGVKYVAGCTLAKILDIAPSMVAAYARKGMPRVQGEGYKQTLYPVDECMEWRKAYIKAHSGQAIVDGELYYSALRFTQATGYSDAVLYTWAKRYGMPSTMLPNYPSRMFPFIRCLQWIDEHHARVAADEERKKEMKAAGIKMPTKLCAPSLCWDCRHARATVCPWFTDYTPVEGWDAEKVRWMESWTYLVHKCPNFERDEPRKQMYY
jgi:hypothetical protein